MRIAPKINSPTLSGIEIRKSSIFPVIAAIVASTVLIMISHRSEACQYPLCLGGFSVVELTNRTQRELYLSPGGSLVAIFGQSHA